MNSIKGSNTMRGCMDLQSFSQSRFSLVGKAEGHEYLRHNLLVPAVLVILGHSLLSGHCHQDGEGQLLGGLRVRR